MKTVLFSPIDELVGKVSKKGFYFRTYKGKQIVQRCPQKWQDTAARKAAREKFAATCLLTYQHLLPYINNNIVFALHIIKPHNM